jgi:hypothetical protein
MNQNYFCKMKTASHHRVGFFELSFWEQLLIFFFCYGSRFNPLKDSYPILAIGTQRPPVIQTCQPQIQEKRWP